MGIGDNIVETVALIGIANCLYLIDRVLQQLNVKEAINSEKKDFLWNNYFTKNCGLNEKFENCIFKVNPSTH